jgi:polar amino acid transport system ATP-binding protein
VVVLSVADLQKSLGGRSILKGVTFTVTEGQACAIIGPSGEGKTTLLKCLNLLTVIDRGEIRFRDKMVVSRTDDGVLHVGADPYRVRQKIGMVFQEWNLWPNLTVRQNIVLAPQCVHGMNRGEADRLAERLSERVRISEQLDVYPNSLSGGQKQRAAIARALAMSPDILMLDEITSALDPLLAAEVLDVMMQLKADGRTLIIVTHHIEFARAISDKVLFLYGGKVHEAGPSLILDEPRTPEMSNFLRQVRRVH